MSFTPPPPPPPGEHPYVPPRPDTGGGGSGSRDPGFASQLPAPPTDRWGIGPGDAHPKATWRWWEAIMVFLFGLFIAGIVGSALEVATGMGEDARFFLFAVAGQVVPLVVLVGWLQLFHGTWRTVVGWPSKVWPEIRAGVLAGLAIYGIGVIGLGTLLSLLFGLFSQAPVETPSQLPSDMGVAEIVAAGFMVIVGASVVEELFFRGVFFRSLRVRRSFWVAGVGSSLLFGMAHLSVEEGSGWGGGLLLVTLMFFVGFGFAYIYERRGNILANMIAHATFNTIGLVLIVLFS